MPFLIWYIVQRWMVMGMTDCVGKELNVGDKVICADSRYADLLIGEVVKLTPKKAWVRYHRSEYGKQYTNEKLKESFQIFKYVEVVRCKDCKKWFRHTEVDRERGECRRYQTTKHETGYCDRGERKDNDTK
jgi:hypothetical protein